MTEREELEMWKSMYMRLLRGTEQAIDVLIKAEQATEDLYVDAGLSREQYASDTGDTKQWIPVMAAGAQRQLSFARPFRMSREEEKQLQQKLRGLEPGRQSEQ